LQALEIDGRAEMFRRGQSCGGGYSSLGYLFGGDDPPRAVRPINRGQQQRSQEQPFLEQNNFGGYGNKEIPYSSSSSVISPENERPAAGKVYHDERYMDTSEGRMGRTNNNYHRADGQNCGNFITVSV